MKIRLLALVLIAGIFTHCSRSKGIDHLDFDQLPYKTLSEYQLFTGPIKELQPVEGVIHYEPNASLFTDYAHKARFLWIPKGATAAVPEDPDLPINFPEHTLLVKNFFYPLDFRKPDGERQIIETRLLVKTKGVWEAYTYLWNEEQTEASLKNTGASIPVNFLDKRGEEVSFTYAVPQKTQCRSCHNRNGTLEPIGPTPKQMGRYLQEWQTVGILEQQTDLSLIAQLVNPEDESKPLADRARAYLDVNCGHCHSPDGPASTSGLYYKASETRPFHLGIWKSPVAAGMGGGGLKFDIHPGKSDESIMVYRMKSTHPGVMMPELGRVTVHQEGVELISEWINSL